MSKGKCQCSSQKTCHDWGGIILKRVHISRCFSPTIMDITPFRNIINEMYTKDTSRKNKKDHNHLVIDEATALLWN